MVADRGAARGHQDVGAEFARPADARGGRLHRIAGDPEVDRIGKEMDEVMRQTGWTGDRAAFLQFLRTDPRFYAKTPDELLMRAAWTAKTIDGKLPSEFKTLPREPSCRDGWMYERSMTAVASPRSRTASAPLSLRFQWCARQESNLRPSD